MLIFVASITLVVGAVAWTVVMNRLDIVRIAQARRLINYRRLY